MTLCEICDEDIELTRTKHKATRFCYWCARSRIYYTTEKRNIITKKYRDTMRKRKKLVELVRQGCPLDGICLILDIPIEQLKKMLART